MISANLSKSERRAIYKRDGYRCALCDSPQGLQIHHIVFRSMAEAMTLQTSSRYVGGATRKPMGRPFRSGIPTSAPAGKTVRALQKSTSRPAQSTYVTTTPTWASSLTLSTVGGFNAPI